jgi:hypothetical protein
MALMVHAEYAPVYIFPDSNASSFCTDKEWNQVLQIMGNATSSYGHRRLGSPQPHRRLKCPKWCGKYCAAMGVGCGDYGRRRRELDSNPDDDYNDDGADDENFYCTDQIAAIDDALYNIKHVSPSCKSLVLGDHNVSCPYFTTECYIHSIGLWNMTGATPKALIPVMNATGHALCVKDEVTFLIETSFEVGKVTATLHYARNPRWPSRVVQVFDGYAAPYYAFGTTTQRNTGVPRHHVACWLVHTHRNVRRQFQDCLIYRHVMLRRWTLEKRLSLRQVVGVWWPDQAVSVLPSGMGV